MATTCQSCDDRGVIHEVIGPGMFRTIPCDCQPPEFWAAKAEQEMADFWSELEEAKRQFQRG